MALDYSAMQARIADDLNRSDLTTQIQTALLRAIRFYERKRWWFNETRSQTFATVASQEFYGTAANTIIPNLIAIDSLNITINSTKFDLVRRSWDYIDRISTTTSNTADPTDFCYYAQQIRLYPIPNAVRTIRIAGSVALTALSSGTDSNTWTTDLEDLICYAAEADINGNKIKDTEAAAVSAANEAKSLVILMATNTSRRRSGMTAPQNF